MCLQANALLDMCTAGFMTRAEEGCVLCSGYLSVWELFSTDIQNFTAYAPFMIVDGNHERDYPQSGAPGSFAPHATHLDPAGMVDAPAQCSEQEAHSKPSPDWQL